MNENKNPAETVSPEALLALAAAHALYLQPDTFRYNETGLDFQVVHALDTSGRPWILRLPRRPDVLPRAENERRVLALLKDRFSVSVPDWQVYDTELIAYPRLAGTPVADIDMEQQCYTWNLQPENLPAAFITSMGQALANLHATDVTAAQAAGLRVHQADQLRERLQARMQCVKQELGVADALWRQWQDWLEDDSYWPAHTSLVHGDLQAAHILTDSSGTVTGFLDWTEAEVSDPAIDFVAVLASFGEDTTKQVLEVYRQAGGKVWPRMLEHTRQRLAAYGITIGLFVLDSGSDEYLPMARQALGLEA